MSKQRRYWALACMAALVCVTAAAAEPPSASAARNDAQWVAAGQRFDGQRQALLAAVRTGIASGPFENNWRSLLGYHAPDWYRDAKFGIFVHWGAYAVPAFKGEWYPRHMYERQGESADRYRYQLQHFGPMPQVGYKDLIDRFKGEHFDPQAWARLFARAGARYVVPVAEHHDGFAMYDSDLSDWTAVRRGPRRDVIGELAKAVRAQGLKLGLSSHRAEHDWFFEYGRQFDSDVDDPRYAALYGPAQRLESFKADGKEVDGTYVSDAFVADWLARSAEIVRKYHPDLFYFDWWVQQPRFRQPLTDFAAYYYDQAAARDQPVVLNYKLDALPEGGATINVERGEYDQIRQLPWQTETSVSEDSWGYAEDDRYKNPDTLLHLLVDVVSKNGNLLLNVGPKADGTIPAQAEAILRALGDWLAVNGEAIYGSRPWTQYGEGPTHVAAGSMGESKAAEYTARDFRFTTGGATLYAIELGWPADGRALIHALPDGIPVQRVELLGSPGAIRFSQSTAGLSLQLPTQAPAGLHAYVFRIIRRN